MIGRSWVKVTSEQEQEQEQYPVYWVRTRGRVVAGSKYYLKRKKEQEQEQSEQEQEKNVTLLKGDNSDWLRTLCLRFRHRPLADVWID